MQQAEAAELTGQLAELSG